MKFQICLNNLKQKRISYIFVEPAYSFHYDNIETIVSQISACERLLKDGYNELEKEIVKREIIDLNLDLMTNISKDCIESKHCSSYG